MDFSRLFLFLFVFSFQFPTFVCFGSEMKQLALYKEFVGFEVPFVLGEKTYDFWYNGNVSAVVTVSEVGVGFEVGSPLLVYETLYVSADNGSDAGPWVPFMFNFPKTSYPVLSSYVLYHSTLSVDGVVLFDTFLWPEFVNVDLSQQKKSSIIPEGLLISTLGGGWWGFHTLCYDVLSPDCNVAQPLVSLPGIVPTDQTWEPIYIACSELSCSTLLLGHADDYENYSITVFCPQNISVSMSLHSIDFSYNYTFNVDVCNATTLFCVGYGCNIISDGNQHDIYSISFDPYMPVVLGIKRSMKGYSSYYMANTNPTPAGETDGLHFYSRTIDYVNSPILFTGASPSMWWKDIKPSDPDYFNFNVTRRGVGCYSIPRPIVDCTVSCTIMCIYKTCDMHEAFVSLNVPSIVGDFVLPNGNITFTDVGTSGQVYCIGRVGIEVFESPRITLNTAKPPVWSWDCAPLCGLGPLSTLPSWARWIIALVFLALGYVFLGLLFTRFVWLLEMGSSATSGWGGAFSWVTWSFKKIGWLFLFFFNILLCGALKRWVFPPKPEEEIDEEAEVVPLRKISKQRKKTSARPLSNKQVLGLVILGLISSAVGISHPLGPLDMTDNFFPTQAGSQWQPNIVDQSDILCTSVAVGQSSVNDFVKTALLFELEPTVGSSVCMTLYVKNGTDETELGDLKFTSLGVGFKYTRSLVQVGLPKYFIENKCECPTGGTHYCDYSHQSSMCHGSSTCFFKGVLGDDTGCSSFLIGSGHFCTALSVVSGNDAFVCDQYDLRLGFQTLGIMVEWQNETLGSYLLNVGTEGSFNISTHGVFTYEGSLFSDAYGELLEGTAFVCNHGSFYLDRDTIGFGQVGPLGDIAKCTRYYGNTTWSCDYSVDVSSMGIVTASCDPTTVTTSLSLFDFENIIWGQKELGRTFQNLATFTQVDGELLASVHMPSSTLFTFSTNLTVSAHVDVADCTPGRPIGAGSFNSSTSSVIVPYSCNRQGSVNILLNGFSLDFVLDKQAGNVSFPYQATTSSETINLLLCSKFGSFCASSSGAVSFNAPVSTPFVSHAVSTSVSSSSGAPTFWDGGLGSSIRPSGWFSSSGFTLPLWADLTIAVVLLLFFWTMFYCGTKVLKNHRD